MFALPLFAVRMYADLSVAKLYDSYKQGLLTADDYNGAVSTVTLVASACNVVGYLVLSVGLSGVIRQVRQMAWSQPLSFGSDFAVGVKQNAGRYLIVFFVLGLLNAFDAVVMQTRNDVLSYVPLCLYVFILLPIALHMLVQVAIYNHKFGDIFATSAFVYLKTLPASILFSAGFMSYGLFDMISYFAVRYICKVLFVVLLPIGILGVGQICQQTKLSATCRQGCMATVKHKIQSNIIRPGSYLNRRSVVNFCIRINFFMIFFALGQHLPWQFVAFK